MSRQERLEIRLGNAHEAVYAMRDEEPIRDPAADTARQRIEGFGDLLDRIEFQRFRLIGLHFHLHLFASAARAAGLRWR